MIENMKVLIQLSNQLISEAMKHLLNTNGYEVIIHDSQIPPNGFTPTIVLLDIATIGDDASTLYPDAKILLLDTGIEKGELIMALLSCKINGILSTQTEPHLLKKAFKMVGEGQFWVDDDTIKTFLHDSGIISKSGKISGITQREKEIINLLMEGRANKEIAAKLSVTEHTIKAHLGHIFHKFDTTSRSKLVSFVMKNGSKGINLRQGNPE
jgi:DNA-binding NarL/FixJ family response regulator